MDHQVNKRLPFLTLEDQYTYLKRRENKKPNALVSLSEELKNMKKLPSIDKKYIQTTRKVQRELLQLQQAINARKNKPSPLSEHRYVHPNIMPIYYQMPMPMPLTIPVNFQYVSQIQPTQNKSQVVAPTQEQPTGPKQEKVQNQKKEDLSKKAKDINKFPPKSRLNRFRIVAYAVYFSIYFKFFSRKFTELRRNWFNERYAINDGKIILEGSVKILKHLHQVDIYKMLQTAKQKVKDIQLQQLNYQKASNSKGSDSALILIHFVTLLLDYAREYMTNEKFIKQHHQVFTVGVLTQNFMLTNLYLPQEAALLHIHPQGYIQVEEQTQIILLMLKIIVKILVYNFLLGLKLSRQWNTKQEKSYGLDDSDMEQLWMMTRNAGIFLTIACEQIYDKTLQVTQNPAFSFNFNEMSPKFNILPAKSLEQIKKTKTIPNPNDSNSKLIMNLEGYADMQTSIAQNPALKKFKDKIKLRIIDFLTVVYTALKYQEAQVYDFCRYMTLDEKYIILKGIKEDMIAKKNKKKKGKKKVKEFDEYGNKIKKKGGKDKDKRDDGDSDDSDDQQGRGKKKNKKGRKNKQNGSDSYESEGEEDSENSEDQIKGKRKKKKLRFKIEQAFVDNKFDGFYKLEKLKKKMAVK